MTKISREEIEKLLADKTLEEALEIAQRYRTDEQPVEGIDYEIENGMFVFSRWYHLKRGACCESGCRNCPYGFSGTL